MNSAKSGNTRLTLQAEAIEDALTDEGDALVAGHLEPRIGVILFESHHRDGPTSPDPVVDLARAVFDRRLRLASPHELL